MRTRTFLAFVAPSALIMFVLVALPLLGVLYLAMHTSHVKSELVEVTTEVPLFGGKTRTDTRTISQPVLDEQGKPVQVWEYVGVEKLIAESEVREFWAALARGRPDGDPVTNMAEIYGEISNLDFWRALEFTLLYTFLTTPFVLVFGFLLALCVNNALNRLKGALIFATLLPMIITPVVSALSIYWLFLDNAVVAATLHQFGLGNFYFLKDAFTIRTLIIFYGVWNATPFAFILLYAGLQTVPRESLEAARIDGASRWQATRLVTIPHLGPLFAVITLIHLMDAYRVFEPIFVFGSSIFANSMQYLTYYVIAFEDNIHKAAAYAVLTVIGIVILLIPVLWKVRREQRGLA